MINCYSFFLENVLFLDVIPDECTMWQHPAPFLLVELILQYVVIYAQLHEGSWDHMLFYFYVKRCHFMTIIYLCRSGKGLHSYIFR